MTPNHLSEATVQETTFLCCAVTHEARTEISARARGGFGVSTEHLLRKAPAQSQRGNHIRKESKSELTPVAAPRWAPGRQGHTSDMPRGHKTPRCEGTAPAGSPGAGVEVTRPLRARSSE